MRARSWTTGDLIDTLWNVKIDEVRADIKDMKDLIDTLWNVKPGKVARYFMN